MTPINVAALLREFQAGRITSSEMNLRLVQSAAATAPEELAPLLPANLLGDLRTLALSPPQSPEGSPRIFAIGTVVGPFDADEHEREERRLWYDGIWQWHHYFKATAPEPDAQAVRRPQGG